MIVLNIYHNFKQTFKSPIFALVETNLAVQVILAFHLFLAFQGLHVFQGSPYLQKDQDHLRDKSFFFYLFTFH